MNGWKYFTSFFDDFSWYAYVFLVAGKSSALGVFKIYKIEVTHQLEGQLNT